MTSDDRNSAENKIQENIPQDSIEQRKVEETRAEDNKNEERKIEEKKIEERKIEEKETEQSKVEAGKSEGRKIEEKRPAVRQLNEKQFRGIGRRELLKLAPVLALGAFAIPSLQKILLAKGLRFNDWTAARLFRPNHLATTFRDSEVVPFAKFPINGYDIEDPGVDLDAWTLNVSGAVQKPGQYKLSQIQSLPRIRQNTRHICVEGWDVIGRFGGARLADFLTMIGADPTARFITVNCADDYYESLDMETARHPQTLLCYEMYDQPLSREHGAPLRLQIPTKIGYKQAKYLTDLKVTHVLDKVGYWEDQGYSWFYGI